MYLRISSLQRNEELLCCFNRSRKKERVHGASSGKSSHVCISSRERNASPSRGTNISEIATGQVGQRERYFLRSAEHASLRDVLKVIPAANAET